MNKRLVIDITQLVNWEGKLTGIPRVMNELARRFSKDKDCAFIYWDSLIDQFQYIDFQDYLAKPKKGNTETKPELRFAQRVAKHLKKIKAGRALIAIYKRINNTKATPIIEQQKACYMPSKDDLMFIMWGEWNDERYATKLRGCLGEGAKIIHMAYDMLPVLSPQFSGHSANGLEQYARKIYPKCELIIAISRNTQKDVVDWLKKQRLEVPKTVVVRLGENFYTADSKKPIISSSSSDGLKGGGFILCVGTIEIRKNHLLLYYVYKLAKEKGIKLPKLVIVGRRGWMTEQAYELMTKDPEVNQDFIFLHDASDENLSWLYENCLFSVYPSFYEGWGLPIAESVSRGVPCICSNTSSMPEVAGDLIEYFSPSSSDECLKVICKLMQPGETEKAREKLKSYKATSWDRTYDQVRKYVVDQSGR